MLPLALLLALQAGAIATARQAAHSETLHTAQTRELLIADCSGDRNTTSCKSYNELINANDKHLQDILSTNSYVCFRPDDDVFLVVSFYQPATLQSPGDLVAYEKFKKGISDDFQLAYGTWKRQSDGTLRFTDAKPPTNKAALVSGSASIADDEISFEYSFKNLANTSTDYSIKIRRSTLRFSERLEAPEEKGKMTQTIDEAGYCVSFHNDRVVPGGGVEPP